MAQKSYGTKLSYAGGVEVGSLTNIGAPELTAGKIEVTNHDNAEGFRQYIQGLRDGGEFAVEGQLDGGDTGQQAIIDHYNQDTDGGVQSMTILFPGGSQWEFDAIVTRLKCGDAPIDGVLPFAATFALTGTPVFTAAA